MKRALSEVWTLSGTCTRARPTQRCPPFNCGPSNDSCLPGNHAQCDGPHFLSCNCTCVPDYVGVERKRVDLFGSSTQKGW
jgi:hypothetical protein